MGKIITLLGVPKQGGDLAKHNYSLDEGAFQAISRLPAVSSKPFVILVEPPKCLLVSPYVFDLVERPPL